MGPALFPFPPSAYPNTNREAAQLEEAGADLALVGATSAGLALGTEVLGRLGASVAEVESAQRTIQEALTLR